MDLGVLSNTQPLFFIIRRVWGAAAAAGAAFLCITNGGKLLQHKLIHVQCTKKKYSSTGIPCTAVRVLGLKSYF